VSARRAVAEPTTPKGVEVLARGDCLALLAQHRLGRVGVSIGALPVILPVAYRLSPRGAVVIGTVPSTTLDAALRNAVVAFEVDGHDEQAESGWSVTVTGVAEEITDADELGEARHLCLRPWAAGGGGTARFTRIDCARIAGQRATSAIDQGGPR
jgi:nitroimidazol reductase NimA-like FMN-containing flavoprotein (pyridoxamine 5'-phosphate oxidase superfamily)